MSNEVTALERAQYLFTKARARCTGDELTQGRRHARVAEARRQLSRAVDASDVAKWTRELEDRTALAAAQDIVVAEGRRLLEEARGVLRIEEHKAALAE